VHRRGTAEEGLGLREEMLCLYGGKKLKNWEREKDLEKGGNCQGARQYQVTLRLGGFGGIEGRMGRET